MTVLSPPATPEHFDAQKALALVCDHQCLTDHTNKAIDPLRLVDVDLQSVPWGQLAPNVVEFTHTVVKIPKKIVEEKCATREMYEDKLRREIERTLREVCMVAVLHPRILRPDAACTITMDGVPVYGLEYARRKEDLFACIEREGTSDDTLASFATDLISALAFLHEQEIYHLDLKPENVVVADFARLQLIDFGFSHCDRWTVSRDVGPFKNTRASGDWRTRRNATLARRLTCRTKNSPVGTTFFGAGINGRSGARCTHAHTVECCTETQPKTIETTASSVPTSKPTHRRPSWAIPPRFIEAILPDLISETPVSMQRLRETLWQDHPKTRSNGTSQNGSSR